ncbi:MAG: hypothetical protein PHE77_02555 [Candidatus Pacebacteria bacterium]|nr:hypothetical protein [Candidatus Paceibacterota bacterium]
MANDKDEKTVTVIFFVEDKKGGLYEIGREEAPFGSIRKVQEGQRVIPEKEQPIVSPHVEVHVVLFGKIRFVPAKGGDK